MAVPVRSIHAASRAALVLAVWLLLTAAGQADDAAQADGKVSLRWKFTPDQKLIWDMTQDMDTSMLVGDMPVDSQMKMGFGMQWHVQEVDGEGTASMLASIQHIQMEFKTAGINATYDSRQPDAKLEGPLAVAAPIFKAISQVEYTLKMTPRGEVRDVKMTEKGEQAIKALAGSAPNMGPLGELVGADGMKQVFEQAASPFPEQPVGVGDVWDTTLEMQNPLVGKQQVVSHFKFDGPVDEAGETLDKIAAEIELNLDQFKPPGVDQFEASDREMTQMLWFDRAAGRLRKSETKSSMKIKMTAMGQTMEQEVDMRMMVRLRTPEEVAQDAAPAGQNAPAAAPAAPATPGEAPPQP